MTARRRVPWIPMICVLVALAALAAGAWITWQRQQRRVLSDVVTRRAPEIGAGAQFTRADSVPVDPDTDEPLQDEDSLIGALITSTRVEWEITKRIDWSLSYRFQLGVPQTEERFTNLFTVLSLEITKHIDVDLSLKFNRAANPPREADGTIPEQNDVTVSFGFGLDF